MESTEERVADIERRMENVEVRLDSAFPGGDLEGHRRYHQALIDDFEDRKKLRRAVLEKILSGAAWGVIVGLALASWHYLKSNLKGDL
jgi:hypothetical protein